MNRLAFEVVDQRPPPPPRRWSKLRWAAWLTLFVAMGLWAGLIISA